MEPSFVLDLHSDPLLLDSMDSCSHIWLPLCLLFSNRNAPCTRQWFFPYLDDLSHHVTFEAHAPGI